MELSPKEEEAIERLSYSLVTKLLLGPISEVVLACAGMRASHGGLGVDRTGSTEQAPLRDGTREPTSNMDSSTSKTVLGGAFPEVLRDHTHPRDASGYRMEHTQDRRDHAPGRT
jgi:hypothetical protein